MSGPILHSGETWTSAHYHAAIARLRDGNLTEFSGVLAQQSALDRLSEVQALDNMGWHRLTSVKAALTDEIERGIITTWPEAFVFVLEYVR